MPRPHLIPTFAAAPVDHRSQLDEPLAEDENHQQWEGPTSSPEPEATSPRRRNPFSGLLTPRLDTGETPTETSGPGSAKPAGESSRASAREVAELISGILGLVVVAAAVGIEWSGRRKLRRPTDAQSTAIARPLSRIALRHADASWLHPDLVDVLAVGNAVGDYLTADEPLITRVMVADDGVPHDLHREDTREN